MVIDKRLWIAAGVLLCGCGSQVSSLREYQKNCIGLPVNELKEGATRPSVYDSYKQEIGWTETTYKLANGNSVWVEVAAKDCFIHWEVNPEGIVVGSHIEGKGCKGH